MIFSKLPDSEGLPNMQSTESAYSFQLAYFKLSLEEELRGGAGGCQVCTERSIGKWSLPWVEGRTDHDSWEAREGENKERQS